MDMREFKAGSAVQGQRLDVFISREYPDFSRSSLDILFEIGNIRVNGVAKKAGHKLKNGDKIAIDDSLLFQKPAEIKLPIIYQDDDVVVINKPAGVLTHSKGALNLEPTVASFINPKITDKSLTGNRAGIVHRLDRGTSGVIITARHSRALKSLQKRFSGRQAKKTYITVTEGVLEPAEAVIDAPIARNPKKPQTFMVSPAGKPAITEYKTLRTVRKREGSFSVLELRPLTGRTHQLRVHLAYINHPIVSDRIYGHDGRSILLHAKSLELTLPNGQRQIFEAPLPPAFEEFTDG